MRLILECHSQIICLDEPASYRALAERSIPERKKCKRIGFKIPRWTEQLDSDFLTDEGEPYQATRIYRGQHIIFLLRDVRDTVGSMLKLKAGSRSWLEVWPQSILAGKVRRDRAFCKTYASELRYIDNCPDPLIATAALYWKYKTKPFFRYRARGYPILGVSYEELVGTPEAVLREICEFLEVPWEPNLLNHPEFWHSETFDNGLTVGDTDPRRAIHTQSVGSWREVLTHAQVDILMDVAGDVVKSCQERKPLVSRHRSSASRAASGG